MQILNPFISMIFFIVFDPLHFGGQLFFIKNFLILNYVCFNDESIQFGDFMILLKDAVFCLHTSTYFFLFEINYMDNF